MAGQKPWMAMVFGTPIARVAEVTRNGSPAVTCGRGTALSDRRRRDFASLLSLVMVRFLAAQRCLAAARAPDRLLSIGSQGKAGVGGSPQRAVLSSDSMSAAAGCGGCRPWQTLALPSAGQVAKGHGWLSPWSANRLRLQVPPLDAAASGHGKPWLCHRPAKWRKAMDGFRHVQLVPMAAEPPLAFDCPGMQ